MPDFAPEVNNKAVRKWGVQKLCLVPPGLVIPELFGVDGLPIVMPAGSLDLGFVTTDGVASSDSISSEGTQMLQTLEEVRSDLTARTKTLTTTFGERNAYVKALEAGMPLEEFPADKYGPTSFKHGAEVADFPYYGALLFKIDGVGAEAVYGVEHFPRIKPTSITDRTRNRSAVDGLGVTFGVYKDAAAGYSHWDAEGGPGIGTGSTLPQITAVSGGGVGDLVRIDGSHLAATTAVTIDGIVAEFEVASGTSVFAIVPEGAAGAAPVVVTTPAGASLPFGGFTVE